MNGGVGTQKNSSPINTENFQKSITDFSIGGVSVGPPDLTRTLFVSLIS